MSDLEKLQEVSVEELVKFFNGGGAVRESKRAREGANIAVRSLAAVGRLKATDRAKDATQLAVLQSMATDKKEFRKYVATSLPHLNPDKKLLGRPIMRTTEFLSFSFSFKLSEQANGW